MILESLVADKANLSDSDRKHLRHVMFAWDALADLFVGDLMLFVRKSPEDSKFLCIGHVRPVNAETLHHEDPVGGVKSWEILGQAMENCEIVKKVADFSQKGFEISSIAVPIRRADGKVIAVMLAQRETGRAWSEQPVRELYHYMAQNFFEMLSEGNFPYPSLLDMKSGPRISDGLIKVSRKGIVEYATPNCVSLFRRFGYQGPIVGEHLHDLGFDRQIVMSSLRRAEPTIDEVQKEDIAISIQIMPVIKNWETTEALVTVRGIASGLRSERLAIAMDTTIREIHHRVKNNLQTVSSLLQLQSRRVEAPEARDAIQDSVRRIGSIAVVHELLSKRGVAEVALVDIVRPLLSLTKTAFVVSDRPVTFELTGEGPVLPENLVSALAVIVTELLQNALVHGFPEGHVGGKVVIDLNYQEPILTITVSDDGVGVPEGFDISRRHGLGLTIVKTLAKGDFKGEVTIAPRKDTQGTVATLVADLDQE